MLSRIACRAPAARNLPADVVLDAVAKVGDILNAGSRGRAQMQLEFAAVDAEGKKSCPNKGIRPNETGCRQPRKQMT